MSLEEARQIIEEIRKLQQPEQGTFVTWLVLRLLRDITYYIVTGLVVWSLGRRIIHAVSSAAKESKHEPPGVHSRR